MLSLSELSPLLFKKKSKRNATIFGCVFNIVATILGSGLLSLSYAIAGCGIWIGSIAFVVVWLLSTHCFLSLAQALKNMPKDCEFKDLADETLPKSLRWLVDFTIIINCFLCSCAYLIIISTLLPEVAQSLDWESPFYFTNRFFWCIVFAVLAFPFILQESLESLRFTSFLVFVLVLFCMAMIIYYAVYPPFKLAVSRGGISLSPVYFGFPGDAVQFLSVQALIVNSFTCSQNIPPIVQNLINPTKTRIAITVVTSSGLCMLIHVAVALGGYITFGADVDSDVLRSYPDGLLPVTIARLSISLALWGSYPVQLHPSRNSLSLLLFKKSPAKLSNKEYYTLTIGIWAATVAIALITDSLGTLLTFVGILSATPLTFIYPNWFLIRTSWAMGEDKWHCSNWCLFFLGILLIPLMLGTELYELVTPAN